MAIEQLSVGRASVATMKPTCATRTFRRPTALRDKRTGRFTTLEALLRASLNTITRSTK